MDDALLLDAIERALQLAARLPESADLDAIRNNARKYNDIVMSWTLDCPASHEEREMVTEKILALHVAISRLSRSRVAEL